MSNRRRRALALGGLALIMGAMAASDIGRREAALARRDGPQVRVVYAKRDLPAGRELSEKDLRVGSLPERYAPAGAASDPFELLGARLAVPAPAGSPVGPAHLQAVAAGAPVRTGERAAEVLAVAAPDVVVAGARVDVVITRDRESGRGGARLALQNAEVLSARPVGDKGAASADGLPRVAATLRVTVRQAVMLAAAQAFARELRLLARSQDDHGRVRALAVSPELESR